MGNPLSRRRFLSTAAATVAIPAALRSPTISALAASARDAAAEPAPPAGGRPWSGGFATLATENDYWVAELEGKIPEGLSGTLFRNGPAKNSIGGHWFAHWFDGDGMLSAITFAKGRVHYRNRYVRTRGYIDEEVAGRVLYRGFGNMRPGGIFTNAFRQPKNVANTSAVRHAKRLLALWEGGPPHALRPSDLETLGVEDFAGNVDVFSAHPRIDRQSGDLFNFGVAYGRVTRIRLYRIDASGRLALLPAIDLPYPVMNHDFALTGRYMVFCLGPLLQYPRSFALGLGSCDSLLRWDGGRPTKILLVPRDRPAQPIWIDAEPFFQFHFVNAYDEGGTVVVDLARYPDYMTIGNALRNFWRSEWPRKGMARLARLRIDVGSGRVESRDLGGGESVEFPQLNPRYIGAKYRYAYVDAMPDNLEAGFYQVVRKVDVETGAVTSHDFSPNGFVGEPVFVSAPAARGEDDGYVVTLVFDAATARTDVVVLDARDIAARPLAVAHLTHHVPFDFHGCFTREVFVRA